MMSSRGVASTSGWKKLGVRSYSEKYDTKPEQTDGIDITEDEELLAKLLMAEDGLGTVKVTGKLDGKSKVVSNHDRPTTQLAPNDDTPAANVLESIMVTAQTLLKDLGNESCFNSEILGYLGCFLYSSSGLVCYAFNCQK
jgi:hypothetical protein